MKYLLDTHALFWWLYFPELLTHKARDILSHQDLQIFASAVSAYEMSYKHHRGRWPEVAPLADAFEEVVLAEGFELLPLKASHAVQAGRYGPEHRDPFDRMLAAQAVVEGLCLLSKDKWLTELGAETLW